MASSIVDLWDKAFKSLPPEICASLERARSHKRDILGAVLQEAESKRELSLRKRWKVTKPNGEVVIVRDVLEKIVAWIQRFKETGDTLVQYDPGHAALPWAAVRFLLQTAISEVQVFGAMAEELENTARMLVRYRIFENTYLTGPQTETQSTMKGALVRLYAEMLTFLGTALKFYRERSIVRLLKGPFRSMDEVRSSTLNEREQEVNALASLFDAETLQSLQVAFLRLSTESSKALSEDRFQEILDWLSVAPYHNHHQYIAQSRLSGAGQWLLQHAKFVAWQTSSSPSLLLIHGIPGSGKSTLCSVFIDHLQSAATANPSAAPFGYFYCANPQSERSRRSANDIMRTILFQLSIDTVHRTKMRDCLSCEYERQVSLARAGKFDMAQLCVADCVRLILEIAEQDPLTIVIDGLDSIDDVERPAVIGALDELVVKADNVVKIFVTSRGTNRSAAKPVAEFEIQITSEETKEDMEAFVDHLIEQSVTKKKLLQGNLHSDTQNMLKAALLAGSHEMFLWARLQVERICRETLEADVIAALQDNLPQDLNLLYQEYLNCISHAGEAARDIAMKVILCVLHIREPLTPQAVIMALAAEKESVLDLTQILTICANLVVLDTKCNTLRFSHQSVQDFLIRHREFSPAAAHQVLSSLCVRACLKGLDSAPFAGLKIPSDDFYVYAAMYWAVHSKLALTFGEDTTIIKSVETNVTAFIFGERWETTLSFESWVENARQIATILPREHAMKRSMCAISSSDFEFVFTLSMFGLERILREALANIMDVDINLPNDSGYSPIYLAAALGQLATVSLLLECGSNINFRCGTHGSPLHAACFSGHLEVVKKLIQHGADVSCGVVYETAFEAACRGRRKDIAVYLIETGLSVADAGDYERVFESAALVGFVKVVQRLQTPKFSAYSTTKATRARVETKIRKAIQGGQTGVLRQFLGQNPTSRDCIPSDAVALATLFNHKSMIEFLLDIGLDIEANGDFGSPLRTAALLNYQSTIRLLLDKGAQVDACGPFGDSLQAAALNGHSYIVSLLIQEGACVDQKTGFYGSALQAAAYHGHIDTVKALLHANAEVCQPGFYGNAFEAAGRGGHDHVLKLLQQKYKERKPLWLPKPRYRRHTLIPEQLEYSEVLLREASPGKCKRDESSRSYQKKSAHSSWPLCEMQTLFESAIGVTTEREKKSEDIYRKPGFRSLEYGQASLSALEEAAMSGCEDMVAMLISRDLPSISAEELEDVIMAAAANGHFPIVNSLVDLYTSRHRSDDTGNGSNPFQPNIKAVLENLSYHLSGSQYMLLRSKIDNPTERYSMTEISREVFLSDFASSCKTGDLELATAIVQKEHVKILSHDEMEGGIQICALHGQTAVADLFLKITSREEKQSLSGDDAFVAAAANGHIGMMRLLHANFSITLTSTDTSPIQRALVMSSEGGHIDAVRYLVMELNADVINMHIRDEELELNVRLPQARARGQTQSWLQNKRNPFTRNSIRPLVDLPNIQDEDELFWSISPLQASLQGFARRFSASDPITALGQDTSPWASSRGAARWRKATMDQQYSVISFLLGKGSNVNDLAGQRMFPIQIAAKYCSEAVVSRMITAGVNLEATGYESPIISWNHGLSDRKWRHSRFSSTRKALFEAVGREMSALPITRALISAGAEVPMEAGAQQRLMAQALSYFEKGISDDSPRNRTGHTLEYVFTEGPGAVLFLLLRRMPDFRTTDWIWSSILQMAAFLDQHELVDLLLSRGADVNATGNYYGTALQAAARRGNDKMVQKLLEAGAQANNNGGRWKTALKAALIDGHENVVHTLLDYGAEISTNEGRGVLQLAAEISSSIIFESILSKRGILPDDGEVNVSLLVAARRGAVNIVTQLIKAGALVNSCIWLDWLSEDGSTPLLEACARGHLDIIELLIFHGADITIAIDNNTPLSIAAKNGRAEAVYCLLSAGVRADDGAALNEAVRRNDVDIIQVLLNEGAEAIHSLPLACCQGEPKTFEVLLHAALETASPDDILDKVFSVEDLDDSTIQMVLSYKPLAKSITRQQFLQICALGLPVSFEMIARQEGFDVNKRGEVTDDHPLQIAAFHLQPIIVRKLLALGARTDSRSPNHSPPLIAALEACTALSLRHHSVDEMQWIVDTLKLSKPDMLPPRLRGEYSSSYFNSISKCQTIVQLLIRHGASIQENESLGPPLHLACLIGYPPMVKILLQYGRSIHDAETGYFAKPLFAAVQGQKEEIISMILQQFPETDYVHPDLGTALHFASSFQLGVSARALLQHGANATALDERNRTPLTIALETELQREKTMSRIWPEETALEAIIKLAKPLIISSDDYMSAANLGLIEKGNKNVLQQLLELGESTSIQEDIVCRVIESRELGRETLKLLIERSGLEQVTEQMIQVVQGDSDLATLLEFQPTTNMSAKTLISQKSVSRIEQLLNYSQDIPITEGVLLRSLELKKEVYSDLNKHHSCKRWDSDSSMDSSDSSTTSTSLGSAVSVLTLGRQYDDINTIASNSPEKGLPSEPVRESLIRNLLRRNGELAITQDMLKAVCLADDAELLLQRLDPITKISQDVLRAACDLPDGERHAVVLQLLKFDNSLLVNPRATMHLLGGPDALDMLEVLLNHQPRMVITSEMFLHLIIEYSPYLVADILERHHKRVIFTEAIRSCIDKNHGAKGDSELRQRLYSLRTEEEGAQVS